MKKLIKAALGAMLLTAVSTSAHAKWVSLSPTYQASEYNSIAGRYLERPTSHRLLIKGEKPQQLWVRSEFIHTRAGDVDLGYATFGMKETRVDEYIAAIDKYFAWQKIALADGDMVDRDIAKVAGNSKTVKIKFRMFSGNVNQHYLHLSIGALGIYSTNMYFELDDAQAFRQTLVDWRDGNLKPLSEKELSDKYK